MKAETADYLAKARTTLGDAQKIATLPLPHIAAREAYLAVFHRRAEDATLKELARSYDVGLATISRLSIL